VAQFRQILLSLVPKPARPAVESFGKRIRNFKNRVFDSAFFRLWLLCQCARHRKKAVILCRTGALGDIICALPMCAEIRKRHPGTFIVFATHVDYLSLLKLSNDLDETFGGKSWAWPYSLPADFKFFGLVEAIYCPRTTNEHSKDGPKCHLMEDLAGSCGITLSNPHPRLNMPQDLLKSVQAKYGLAEHIAKGRLMIGINCGYVWPVRMWPAEKWQALLDLIHAEFDAAVMLFGFHRGSEDDYDRLKGVQVELRMPMNKDELVALIANCHLMISVDSGPTHISGAVGVPLVGLYGALNPEFFMPRFSPAVGLSADVPCLFCNHTSPIGHWQSGCPNNIRCMKELEVQPVFQAVKSMLKKYGKSRALPASAP
jgi:ADP-heptose:LPS heptosyltransferase